ncbi:MAG: hypothetical protein FJW23_07670 [Acidimicrobiia bacterium]|nr:hypothetical protein [Acidimicrobiia bacterium]
MRGRRGRWSFRRDFSVTLESRADRAHSFTLDEYRFPDGVPAGGVTTFELRADRAGTFVYYCGLTTDPGCRATRGTLVVRSRT